MFGGDEFRSGAHQRAMLGSSQILAVLAAKKEAGELKNADLQRLLNLPSSRVSEIFKGGRRLTVDEAKTLVEAYGIEEESARRTLSATRLAPILAAVLPLAPTAGSTDQSASALAEALVRGLELLGDDRATPPTEGEIRVAARGAVARFRDLLLQ